MRQIDVLKCFLLEIPLPQEHVDTLNNYLDDLLQQKDRKSQADRLVGQIKNEDEILDVVKSMRGYFNKINSKSITTLDVNEFEDYPDIVFDLCDELPKDLNNKFDKIICIAILEHVYDPFKAVNNLKKMLKDNGTIFGYVPYLYISCS